MAEGWKQHGSFGCGLRMTIHESSLGNRMISLVTGERGREPTGAVHVVDPSPLNWLWIQYNTAEELVRVNSDGHVEPAATEEYR